MIDLNIPIPDIVEELDFEDIKSSLIQDIKKVYPDYIPLESDRYMAVIEAVAYREIILRERINKSIKSMFLTTSGGIDLDNLVTIYGIERLKGVKPKAEIELKLSTILNYSITIPAGTKFTDRNRTRTSVLLDDVTIPGGESKVTGKIELDEFVIDSLVKTETLITPLPYVIISKQLTAFTGGFEKENDKNLKIRAIESLERYTTAGSRESYQYHAKSATSQVKDVHVESPSPGRVRVVIQVDGDEDNAVLAVKNKLSEDKVRPLTDKVTVEIAKYELADIKATLELLNLIDAARIISEIENEFNNKIWKLGEDINLSYIYKILHKDGVYRVILNSPQADIKVDNDKYVIVKLQLNTRKADL